MNTNTDYGEEDIDTDESTTKTRHAEVVQYDGRDGIGAQVLMSVRKVAAIWVTGVSPRQWRRAPYQAVAR